MACRAAGWRNRKRPYVRGRSEAARASSLCVCRSRLARCARRGAQSKRRSVTRKLRGGAHETRLRPRVQSIRRDECCWLWLGEQRTRRLTGIGDGCERRVLVRLEDVHVGVPLVAVNRFAFWLAVILDAHRIGEALAGDSLDGSGRSELVDLDPVARAVGHPKVARLLVDRALERLRKVLQIQVRHAGAARGKLPDATAAEVGDIQVAAGVKRDPEGLRSEER